MQLHSLDGAHIEWGRTWVDESEALLGNRRKASCRVDKDCPRCCCFFKCTESSNCRVAILDMAAHLIHSTRILSVEAAQTCAASFQLEMLDTVGVVPLKLVGTLGAMG